MLDTTNLLIEQPSVGEYVITVGDVVRYLHSLSPNDEIGITGSDIHCIVANAAFMKYRAIFSVSASSIFILQPCANLYGTCRGDNIAFSADISKLVIDFDSLVDTPTSLSIKKQEYLNRTKCTDILVEHGL